MSKIVVGLCALAATMLALSATFAASALAGELPAFSVQTGFKGTSGKATFETKSEVKVTCASSSIEATAVTKEGGTYHLTEKECSSSGGLVKCTTKGDTTGTVLIEGNWGFATKSSTEAFLLLSTNGSTFECSLSKEELKGTLLSKITPLNTETTKFELSTKESKGTQEFVEYTNEFGEKETAKLLTSINGGAFEALGAEAVENKVTTTSTTKLLFITGPTVNVNPIEVNLGLLEVKKPVSQLFTYKVATGSTSWTPVRTTLAPNTAVGDFEIDVTDNCLGKTLTAGQTCTATVTVEALLSGKEAHNIRYRVENWAPSVKLTAKS